jgi:hypothetical protein
VILHNAERSAEYVMLRFDPTRVSRSQFSGECQPLKIFVEAGLLLASARNTNPLETLAILALVLCVLGIRN